MGIVRHDPEAGTYSYTLNADLVSVQELGAKDTAEDVFYVTVADSSGASHTQSITVTVQGTNDAPVLTLGLPLHVTHDPAGGLSNSAEDAFSVKDVDSLLDSLHYSVGEAVTDASGLTENALSCYVLWDGNQISYVPAGEALSAAQADHLLGTFSINLGSNKYAFDLAEGSLAVRSLADGELKEFNINVNVSDGSDVASSQVKVQITGTNDAPELLYGSGAADTRLSRSTPRRLTLCFPQRIIRTITMRIRVPCVISSTPTPGRASCCSASAKRHCPAARFTARLSWKSPGVAS